ncbi:hypothetical protein TNCV_1786481 [Trichonephila clavipes]|nr:hypothetical protein TNCV_1786481 [Trichonephila clavipes]
MDELIEMQEQDIEKLEYLDSVQSEDRMKVGNLTGGNSLTGKGSLLGALPKSKRQDRGRFDGTTEKRKKTEFPDRKDCTGNFYTDDSELVMANFEHFFAYVTRLEMIALLRYKDWVN